jgi:hypothetical protein
VRRSCEGCGCQFVPKAAHQRFHDNNCRLRAHRRGPGKAAEPTSVSLVMATELELGTVGATDSVMGQQALELARSLVSPFTTGAAKASLSKEFRSVMAEVLAGSVGRSDELDELRTRRDAKRAAG